MIDLPIDDLRELYANVDQRIIDFFGELGIGCGDDPVGFLLASHAYMAKERNIYKKSLNDTIQVVKATAVFSECIKRAKSDNLPPARIKLSDGTVLTGEVAEVFEAISETIISIGDIADGVLKQIEDLDI